MLIAMHIALLTAEGACSHGCVGGCLRLGSMIFAGVPPALPPAVLSPPPPHEQTNTSSNDGSNPTYRRNDNPTFPFPPTMTNPSRPTAQSQGNVPEPAGISAPAKGAVVLTLTLKHTAVVALTGSGTAIATRTRAQ